MYEVECQSGKPVVSTLDTARNTGAAVSLALDVSTSGICGAHGCPSEFMFLLDPARPWWVSLNECQMLQNNTSWVEISEPTRYPMFDEGDRMTFEGYGVWRTLDARAAALTSSKHCHLNAFWWNHCITYQFSQILRAKPQRPGNWAAVWHV